MSAHIIHDKVVLNVETVWPITATIKIVKLSGMSVAMEKVKKTYTARLGTYAVSVVRSIKAKKFDPVQIGLQALKELDDVVPSKEARAKAREMMSLDSSFGPLPIPRVEETGQLTAIRYENEVDLSSMLDQIRHISKTQKEPEYNETLIKIRSLLDRFASNSDHPKYQELKRAYDLLTTAHVGLHSLQ